MQLQVLAETLARRWYLVLVSIVLAAAGAATVVWLQGPRYEAEGAVLLIPPGATVQRVTQTPTQSNPFLVLGGLTQARDIVIRAMTASATNEELCRQSGNADFESMRAALCKSRPSVEFEVTPDFTSSAPIVLITIDADSPAHATTALTEVMKRVPLELDRLQQDLNLRESAKITSLPIVSDDTPQPVHKTQIRSGLVVGVGSLGLLLLAIALLDGALQGVGQNKGKRDPEPEENWAYGGAGTDPSESDFVVEESQQPSDWGWPSDDERGEGSKPTVSNEPPNLTAAESATGDDNAEVSRWDHPKVPAG